MAEAAILSCRLPIVALLAQRLMVASIPEQIVIALMRYTMIDNGCQSMMAFGAEDILALGQIPLAIALPVCSIASLGCGRSTIR